MKLLIFITIILVILMILLAIVDTNSRNLYKKINNPVENFSDYSSEFQKTLELINKDIEKSKYESNLPPDVLEIKKNPMMNIDTNEFNRMIENKLPVVPAFTQELNKTKPVETESVDLSQYVHKSQVPDLSKYVLKTEVPVCPDMSKFVLKSEIPKCDKPDLSKYILKSEIPSCPVLPDLNKYVLKTSVPSCKPVESGIETNIVINNSQVKDKKIVLPTLTKPIIKPLIKSTPPPSSQEIKQTTPNGQDITVKQEINYLYPDLNPQSGPLPKKKCDVYTTVIKNADVYGPY